MRPAGRVDQVQKSFVRASCAHDPEFEAPDVRDEPHWFRRPDAQTGRRVRAKVDE